MSPNPDPIIPQPASAPPAPRFQIFRNPALNWIAFHPLFVAPILLAVMLGLSFLIEFPELSRGGNALLLLGLGVLCSYSYRPWRENKPMLIIPLLFAVNALYLLTAWQAVQWLTWALLPAALLLILWKMREDDKRHARERAELEAQIEAKKKILASKKAAFNLEQKEGGSR